MPDQQVHKIYKLEIEGIIILRIKKISLVSLTVLSLITACSIPVNDPNNINSNVLIKDSRAVIVTSPINGIVEFPDLNKFKTKATVADIGQNATVSLIYPSDHLTNPNKTIATGITNESGVFTINSGFSAATNQIYILEGSRRIGSSGNALMAVRTMIKWTGSGWESITQGGISINSKTTALSIMSGLVPGVSSIDVIGKIASGVPSDIIVGGQTKIKGASITDAADLVAFALSKNQDPTLYMNYSNGVFSLKQPNDVINLISRVVGTSGTFIGDGAQAKDGAIKPISIAFDSTGNMFIADRSNHRIRRVDNTTGIITTFAGTGVYGSTIDPGSASNTQLYTPSGIAFDSSGNLFIADKNNHRVLKINSAGTSVVVLAGITGVSGSNNIEGSIRSESSLLNYPINLSFDSLGNLYITDSVPVIKKVEMSKDVTP